jgi:DNA-binding XRE family transcriptional regulator
MRQIRPMHGMSVSTMAMTIGMVRRMSIVFGVLEVDSDLIFDFFNPNHQSP